MAGTKPKAKMGQPSKKDTINLDGIKLCYSKGMTDKEAALCLQITDRTLDNWKKKDPEFFRSIKEAKKEYDDSVVVRSLHDRAVGYTCPETKAQWVQEPLTPGRWEYAEMVKHYPPDPTSMIFWLKNRQPEQWRDKVETEHTHKFKIEEIVIKVVAP